MKVFRLVLPLALLLALLCACSSSGGTWQEQYDLGQRYLQEENYEQALLAFEAAIQIDPKRPEAYVGMAQAYVALGDPDSAAGILVQGQQAAGESQILTDAWAELGLTPPGEEELTADQLTPENLPQGETARTVRWEGEDGGYTLCQYDAQGNLLREIQYDAQDNVVRTLENYYDSQNRLRCQESTLPNDWSYVVLDTLGREIYRRHRDINDSETSYLYQGTQAAITCQEISDGQQVSGSLTCTMGGEDHSVLLEGYGFSLLEGGGKAFEDFEVRELDASGAVLSTTRYLADGTLAPDQEG